MTIVPKTEEIVEALNKKDIDQWSGDELSRAVVKLSLLLVNLGREVSEATLNANSAYMYRKFKFATEFKRIRQELELNIKDSEMTALQNIKKSKEEEITSQYNADVLRSFYDDVSRLVMSLQSRLKFLRDEKVNSKDFDKLDKLNKR